MVSAFIGFENEVLGDDHAHGPARADGDGRLDIEVALDKPLSGLTGVGLGRLAQGLDQVVLIVAERQFRSNAEQGCHRNALQQLSGMEIDLVGQPGKSGCVGTRQVLDNDRRAVGHDDAFPDDGFYGEETGLTHADADNLWLVDPIDGTKAFVRQYPFFSTQIALMHKGEMVLGVSSGTMFDELAWAERGKGAWLNGKQLRVSDIDDPERSAYSTGNLKSLAGSDGWARLAEFVAVSDRIRGYGDFYHYHLLASGKIEAVIESDVNILDVAALSVIVTEAGGRFTDLNGNAPGLATRSVLAANPSLHAILLSRLSGYVD